MHFCLNDTHVTENMHVITYRVFFFWPPQSVTVAAYSRSPHVSPGLQAEFHARWCVRATEPRRWTPQRAHGCRAGEPVLTCSSSRCSTQEDIIEAPASAGASCSPRTPAHAAGDRPGAHTDDCRREMAGDDMVMEEDGDGDEDAGGDDWKHAVQ